jgi:PhnB protein
VDATFQRAVDAGCGVIAKPEDMFWGARFAMLSDPFGYRWMLNAALPQS